MERVRVNAKQTAKGAWQFDATAETYDRADGSINPEVMPDKLLEAVQACEKKFRDAGKVIASEEPSAP